MTSIFTSIQVTGTQGLRVGSIGNHTRFHSEATGVKVITLPNVSDTIVGLSTVDTLNNKTLIEPVISSISNGGLLTVPSGTDVLVARDTADTLTNKILVEPVISSISNGGLLTLPSGPETLVALDTADTLSNKTLIAPVISSISNEGVLTLPEGTDTLVGRNTTDTFTNKTLVGGSDGNTVSANQISTASGSVSVSSTAPALGQVLVATSSSSAEWQTLSPQEDPFPGLTFVSDVLTTTTGDANQLLSTVSTEETSNVLYFTSRVVGFNTSSLTGITYEIRRSYIVNEGALVALGDPIVFSYGGSGFTTGDALTTGDVRLSLDGANIIVSVNGQESQTINWRASSSVLVA